MIVYLARHCESEYNVQNKLNSDPAVKVALTVKGVAQAKQLALSLKHIEFDKIYTSELLRTQQTADFINKYHSKQINIDSRLNDNKSGFEGQDINLYIQAVKSAPNGYTAKFNDGESLAEVLERVKDFLNYLKRSNISPCVIVTSGYIIECLYGIASDIPPELASSFSIPQGEFTKLLI